MILRKPYAFIIKHFKLIHLIILGVIAFSLYTLSGITSLFDSLVITKTYTYSGAGVYVNSTIYIFLLISLFLSVVLFVLLKKKDKPVGLYLGLIIYNIFSFVYFIFAYSVLKSLILNNVEADTLRSLRDISTIVTLPGYVFCVLCFIRGIGFNIKQFNFSKDIAELNIAEKDSEEFELMVGQNNYKYMRYIRRTIREVKYYILENMVAITIISIVLGLILVFLSYKYYNKYMSKVKERQVTQVNGINYVVNKAYITSEDYKGDKIKEGSKFVVIDMIFENVSSSEETLNMDSFSLINGKLKYKPTLAYNYKFYDLGIPYDSGESIPPDSYSNKYVIFELPDTTNSTKFTFRIEYGVSEKKDKVLDDYVQFDISANDIDIDDRRYNLNIGDEVYSNVNDENEVKFTITNYSFQQNYVDNYVICNKKLECRNYKSNISANGYQSQIMLILDYHGTMFDDAKFTKKYNTFPNIFGEFAYIEYKTANRIYNEKITILPNSTVEDKIFALVDSRVLNAKTIDLKIRFRNREYVYSLKA